MSPGVEDTPQKRSTDRILARWNQYLSKSYSNTWMTKAKGR